MTDRPNPLPWDQPGFLDSARSWIRRELKRLGLQRIGEIEQPHLRPWSTVLRVPTDAGDYFFKAVVPALDHEPTLTQALYAWRPDCMIPAAAVDLERGWLLMPDAGVTLRSLVSSPADFVLWRRMLPLYAGVQIELADRSDALLALGALDRRLASLPEKFETLVTDEPFLLIGQPDGLKSDQVRRLQRMIPHYRKQCERLAEFGLPETLHHDDFHDANIFVRDGRIIFSDWGESCVGHPFFSLMIALRSLAYRLELEELGPETAALRDLYLQSWAGYGAPDDLVEAFQLARQVAMPARALTWKRVIAGLEDPLHTEDAPAVPGWLEEYLQTQPA